MQWSYANDWTEPTFDWDIFALAGDPGERRARLDDHRRQVRLAGRPLRRAERPALDPDRRVGQHDQQRRLRGLRQQPDALRRSRRRARRGGSWSGPNICEITGVFVTPDERTMFVGIQHPGEAPSGANDPANPKRYSSWPDGAAGGRPRSAMVVITKDDGGPIGS